MAEYLVSKKYDIIQYKGESFRVPTSIDLKNKVGSELGILEKRIAISESLGLEFIDKRGAFACTDCQHTDIFRQALIKSCDEEPIIKREVLEEGDIPGISKPAVIEIGSPLITNDETEFCKYKPSRDSPHWLSYYWMDGKPGFAANMRPCVADTGLLIALFEGGKLAPYKIDCNIDAREFPFITQVTPDTESEKKALEIYQKLLIPNGRTFGSWLRSLWS